MAMRSLRLVIIIICLSIIFITAMPILIFSYILSPYDIIFFQNSKASYKENPSLIEEINIQADEANIEIIYITRPVEYSVKIDYSIDLRGYGLAEKQIDELMEIRWQENTSKLNFSMIFQDYSEISNLVRDITIKVSVGATIKCNFNIDVTNGNTKLIVPFGVSVGSIFTNISNGDIYYEFISCYIFGDIFGSVKNGDISFRTEKVQYSQNCNLTFFNELGYTLIDILQDCEIGGNITGNATTELGTIKIIYKEASPNIGAKFILNNKRNLGAEGVNNAIGFYHDASLSGQVFVSYDYPAQCNYNFSLHKPYPSDMGDYLWNLYSIPN